MTEDIYTIASALTGAPATEVVQASHGGNSRVYKVTAGGRTYALKQYPADRNRLDVERQALELMAKHNVVSVPEWYSAQAPYALMGWVEGAVIKEPKESDIAEAAVFLEALHRLSKKTPAQDMPLAAEACLSGQLIIDQLEKRLAALMPHAAENPALQQFLTQRFLPLYTSRFLAAKSMSGFADELPHADRTLIAADFGFHNIMRTPDGDLTFIDFEYFGWDDPVKLMSDFLLHPATPLTLAMKKNFHTHAVRIYGNGVQPRFAAFYPLFGLRWALILLNEFIPARWQARKAARGDGDWDTIKTEQIAKAEAMLTMSEKFE